MADIAATVKILTTAIKASAKINLGLDTSCLGLNSKLTQAERQTIQRVASIKTGQTRSYATGDDGDREDGRGVDFLTLDCNNSFGNTNKNTDKDGLQVYGDDYMIDHLTGLGWFLIERGLFNWATAVANALTDTSAGFNDWFMPNIRQLFSLAQFENIITNKLLNYEPINNFESATSTFWTSTTQESDPTFANVLINNAATPLNRLTKTAERRLVICRKHFG